MSDAVSSVATSSELEKPVQNIKFPPFPEPTDDDFDDDITEEEKQYYKDAFTDLNIVTSMKLHCSACDKHLGCAALKDTRMRIHPMLRTLVCQTCHTFYNSGEFEKGDDGSELYCRWCGQGGQVYCCSDCPHVFCAKCIRRNLGNPKIKEIENTDDWKCFKCNFRCLWDLRALCWALLRYCELKNKWAYKTDDPILKSAYNKDCAVDYSECCKNKNRRKEKEPPRKRETENIAKKSTTPTALSKIGPSIQVKKFASISYEDTLKVDSKKPQKRPSSPKQKQMIMKNPLTIMNTIRTPTAAKKIRLNDMPANVLRLNTEKNPAIYYPRIKPRTMPNPPVINSIPIVSNHYNGYNSNPFPTTTHDNINLSLENLTQGLDMSAVASMSNDRVDDDVVCTPDFPLEPLCEVTEDNNDDDVQCITPGPVATPRLAAAISKSQPPPLVSRVGHSAPDLNPENIIQMTENDVTVNAATGGLKFRVDPQSLSSNKMYRLPDGRIFAINANSSMPGGYSATIVAVTDSNTPKAAKTSTFAAKLTAVTPKSTPKTRLSNSKRSTPKPTKVTRGTGTAPRDCDLNAPVEWFRYNLIDAVDSLEYSLSRLNKLKKEATTLFLRTRSVSEMRNLHKSLDRLLNNSAIRFNEIQDNLSKGLKQYINKKSDNNISDEDDGDDDDVEILNDMSDDPIFIDENSMESNDANNVNGNQEQEVDLTGRGSSVLNDSIEKIIDKSLEDPLRITEPVNVENDVNTFSNNHSEVSLTPTPNENTKEKEQTDAPNVENTNKASEQIQNDSKSNKIEEKSNFVESVTEKEEKGIEQKITDNDLENIDSNLNHENNEEKGVSDEIKSSDDLPEKEIDKGDNDKDEKSQDAEMSEEMIETLLKDDGDDVEYNLNSISMDSSEII